MMEQELHLNNITRMDDVESENDDDWEEMDDEVQSIECLFCKDSNDNFNLTLKHLELKHNFSLPNFKSKHNLDIYSYIKLINFIKKRGATPEELNVLSSKAWENDEYLIPACQDDPWLMLDIDELNDAVTNTNDHPNNSENEKTLISQIHLTELHRTIESLKAELEQRDTECFLAKQQIEEMTKTAHKLVFDSNEVSKPSEGCARNSDKAYFNCYNHFAIHHEMLTDKIRTESYRDALLTNSHLFNNCVMLDVGCGTGILSMFAAKCGCKKIISVDQSDIIYHAMNIVSENNLSNIITLKKGKLEDIDLEVDKVDAIISEWMGYFLLYEGMLDSVIYARDHYLSPTGKLLPNRCTISVVGSGDTKRYINLVDYWSNVYGFKMSCMKAEVVHEAGIEFCDSDDIVTNVAEIQSFDLYTVTTDCVNFSSPFSLTVKRSGSLTAIIGYFDVYFDLENPVHFSTGPHATRTHWRQTVFSLSEPISVTEGETVNGVLICRRLMNDRRGLTITIKINDLCQDYYLD